MNERSLKYICKVLKSFLFTNKKLRLKELKGIANYLIPDHVPPFTPEQTKQANMLKPITDTLISLVLQYLNQSFHFSM